MDLYYGRLRYSGSRLVVAIVQPASRSAAARTWGTFTINCSSIGTPVEERRSGFQRRNASSIAVLSIIGNGLQQRFFNAGEIGRAAGVGVVLRCATATGCKFSVMLAAGPDTRGLIECEVAVLLRRSLKDLVLQRNKWENCGDGWKTVAQGIEDVVGERFGVQIRWVEEGQNMAEKNQ